MAAIGRACRDAEEASRRGGPLRRKPVSLEEHRVDGHDAANRLVDDRL